MNNQNNTQDNPQLDQLTSKIREGIKVHQNLLRKVVRNNFEQIKALTIYYRTDVTGYALDVRLTPKTPSSPEGVYEHKITEYITLIRQKEKLLQLGQKLNDNETIFLSQLECINRFINFADEIEGFNINFVHDKTINKGDDAYKDAVKKNAKIMLDYNHEVANLFLMFPEKQNLNKSQREKLKREREAAANNTQTTEKPKLPEKQSVNNKSQPEEGKRDTESKPFVGKAYPEQRRGRMPTTEPSGYRKEENKSQTRSGSETIKDHGVRSTSLAKGLDGVLRVRSGSGRSASRLSIDRKTGKTFGGDGYYNQKDLNNRIKNSRSSSREHENRISKLSRDGSLFDDTEKPSTSVTNFSNIPSMQQTNLATQTTTPEQSTHKPKQKGMGGKGMGRK